MKIANPSFLPLVKRGYNKIHRKDKAYQPVTRSLTVHGTALVRQGRFVECLAYIHDQLFSELEKAMSDVIEALATLEEECK